MKILFAIVAAGLLSCTESERQPTVLSETSLDGTDAQAPVDTLVQQTVVKPASADAIETGSTTPQQILAFAKTLQGIPYKYASTDPAKGFDCSGFITYVFNHFNIEVPRSSVDFTDVGTTVELDEAKPADLILFTGTDSTIRIVGHMGIIESNNNGRINFIHSTSGKADGVTITPLNDYYMGRLVKVTRIFEQNNR